MYSKFVLCTGDCLHPLAQPLFRNAGFDTTPKTGTLTHWQAIWQPALIRSASLPARGMSSSNLSSNARTFQVGRQ